MFKKNSLIYLRGVSLYNESYNYNIVVIPFFFFFQFKTIIFLKKASFFHSRSLRDYLKHIPAKILCVINYNKEKWGTLL